MVPPDATHWDDQAQVSRSGATVWAGIHQQIVVDPAAFRDAAQSRGFDEAHRAGAVLVEEAKTIAEWHARPRQVLILRRCCATRARARAARP
jgi:hypothetical protein